MKNNIDDILGNNSGKFSRAFPENLNEGDWKKLTLMLFDVVEILVDMVENNPFSEDDINLLREAVSRATKTEF